MTNQSMNTTTMMPRMSSTEEVLQSSTRDNSDLRLLRFSGGVGRVCSSSSLLVLTSLMFHARGGEAFSSMAPPVVQPTRHSQHPADALLSLRLSSKSRSRAAFHSLVVTAANPDSSSEGAGSHTDRKPGWRRRVMSRLGLHRQRQQESLSMKSKVVLEDETKATSDTNFVLENFEKLSPEHLFSTTSILLERRGPAQQDLGNALQPAMMRNTPPELPLVIEEIVKQDSQEAAAEEERIKDSSPEQTQASVVDIPFQEAVEDNSAEDTLMVATTAATSLIGATSSFEGGHPVRKLVRGYAQSILLNLMTNWCKEAPTNLQVRCSPTGSVLWALLRGQFHCNARVDFDRLVFGRLQVSGGTLEASRLALNVFAFAEDRSVDTNKGGRNHQKNITSSSSNTRHTQVQSSSAKNEKTAEESPKIRKRVSPLSPRFQNQFDFHAHDCILTSDDLFESVCIRNGLCNLVMRILKNRGVDLNNAKVVIQSIDILDNGKLDVKGKAGLIPFQVRTGLDVTCRGHVLTFPGLEISLLDSVPLFVPIIPTMEVDLGHNARFRDISIDGAKKQIKLSASVTITPRHTLKLKHEYQQSSDAYSARFSVDVGRWLTRIGRFSL